jgi:hypothetical protein
MAASNAGATWKNFGIGCLVWLVTFVPLSGMLFDAPGSENSPATWVLAASIWTYPVLHLIGVVGSRFASANSEPMWKVRLWAYAPLINVVWFIAAIVWIELRCDGKFVCR